MKLLILLFCLIVTIYCKATHKPTTPKPICEGVHVNGKLHSRRIIMNGINRPYQLVMYNHEHQVFYSYNIGDDTQDTFDIAYVKINDTMPTPVHGIKNGFALALDEHGKRVFFGGSEGIYEADLTKDLKDMKHIVKDRDIWDMFYHKHQLYFVEYPSMQLQKYHLKEKTLFKHEHITEKIFQFVIDGDNDAFITTKEGVYMIKCNTTTAIPFSGPKIFRAVEVNHDGVAHFASQNGIYVPEKKNESLSEIVHIKNIFGLAFDTEDNIIYSNPHEIVKLVPRDCN